ncbi:MAG: AAA family ATPase [Cyanobacteria bacterium P01_F01_bin.53]
MAITSLTSNQSQPFPHIPGYTVLEAIYISAKTAVYRALSAASQQVVIKVLPKTYPSCRELTVFRNQYTIAKQLPIPGIVQPIALEPWRNGYALVLEDFGGISLNRYSADNVLPAEEVLGIAVQMADILKGLGEHHVVHKDIKPANILIHVESKRIQLIDFSIATLLPKETQETQSPSVLEGTLAYLAPEQTGRMNRGIDYRSDFYGLGVTLYKLLTGVLPFAETDPLELIHAHIAKAPVPPHEVAANIPVMVSEIVLKLMAKNAEDRYQSALGLKHDLIQCLHELKNTGRVNAFELGQKDVCDRFLIPEKLYGRETDVKTLLDAFERVAQGHSELMLVAGFSGVGKTAVVKEVHKPITRQHGYFIEGKFDQFNRNIPLSAFVQAFRSLISQLLGESDAQLADWKGKILEAVGDNGQVLIEVIPELQTVIGVQPQAADLPDNEAQNRFNSLLVRFVQVFTTIEHPLVLFLDDLQWADSASLSLLNLLMGDAESDSNTGYLLVLGAYRDNEVAPGHPLTQTLETLKKSRTPVNTLALTPLAPADIASIVSDTLLCTDEVASHLSLLIHQKTQGNPFFTTQFLGGLHAEGCITFDPEVGNWRCNFTQIQALALTDNVVEFMVERLWKLPETTQKVLKFAACIGNRFELDTLAAICNQPQAQIAAVLWPALQQNFLIPESGNYKFFQGNAPSGSTQLQPEQDLTDQALLERNSSGQNSSGQNSLEPNDPERRPQARENVVVAYRFLHDRVQQAAYSLIPPDQKQAIHLKIGQRLLKNTPQGDQENILFTLVGQLNMGRALLTTTAERDLLIQLNLRAGKKAKLSTAYSAAIDHFAIAQQLLAPDSWVQDYQTTLEIFVEALGAEYLNTNFEAIETLAAPIIERAQTLLDIIPVHEIRIRAWIGIGDQHQALNIGLAVLDQLGITLLDKPPQPPSNIAALIDAPAMSDRNKLAAMDIMAGIITSAWAVNPDYFCQLTFTMVALSLQAGNAPASPFGYAWYGSILCESLGDSEAGYEFGKLAVALLDALEVRSLRSKVLNIYASTIGLWQGHVRQYFDFHLDGIQSGLETGDLEFASYNAAEYSQYLFLSGAPLETVRATCEQKLLLIKHLKQDFHVQYLAPWLQGTLNLLGKASPGENPVTESVTTLEGEIYSEQAFLPAAVEENQLTLVFVAYFLKSFLSYLFGDYKQALAYGELATEHNAGVSGSLFVPTQMFYVSLARLACLNHQDSNRQAPNHHDGVLDEAKANELRKAVEADLAQLQHWAKSAPMNYQHKCDLLAAELARYDGLASPAKTHQLLTAIDRYEQAITGAKAHGYLQEEALVNERAAQFYLDWGKEKMAIGYLQEAYYGYSRWGAIAKTQALEQRYPDLLQPPSSTLSPSPNPLETIASLAAPNFSRVTLTSSTQATRGTTTDVNTSLDLTAILKAAQALSGTIELDSLLRELTTIILQNSGGDYCALILADDDDQWQIESLATPTQTNLVAEPLVGCSHLPVKLIQYVKNTHKTVVIDNLKTRLPVVDAYLNRLQPKSVLCLPLLNQGELLGALYLQNKAVSHTFSRDRILVLDFLCSQAAISLKNARLYQQAQTYAQQAQTYATQIEQSQLQMMQTEKMASLGNLVAGVAHEINNPIGFLNGSVKNAQMYLKDLLGHLELYQKSYPQVVDHVLENAEDIDLEFICEDFPKLLNSMLEANSRIKGISQSLRTFSRADAKHKVSADLHEGLDSTLLILKYRLKANENRPAIRVVKNYGELAAIECFPGQLNQVFMNLLANAIDVFDEAAQSSSFAELESQPQIITITTLAITPLLEQGSQKSSEPNSKPSSEQGWVEVRIRDNGKGIPEDVKERIFDHLFTTKAVDKGTGLGLAIARQIIVEAHGGYLTMNSKLGEGTEFCIRLPFGHQATKVVRT